MQRSWSPQVLRIAPGQDCLIHRLPDTAFPSNSRPFSSSSAGKMPGRGRVAKVGLASVTPARLLIIIPPVSVCHQVSTMGALPLPIFLSYQFHASALMGSPTVPSTSRLLRSLFCMGSSPKAMRLRMAVGAVYRILTRCF